MPDILDIHREINKVIMGAEITLDTYEWIGGTADDVKYLICPQVTVRVTRNDQIHQAYCAFDPTVWESITAEYLGKLFRQEFESIL